MSSFDTPQRYQPGPKSARPSRRWCCRSPRYGASCNGGCDPVLCNLFCENGFAQDANGCDICECAPDEEQGPNLCGDFVWQICNELNRCPVDYVCGEPRAGCTASRCDCDPNTGEAIDCTRDCRQNVSLCEPCEGDECGGGGCEPIVCDLNCRHGFARDDNGCEICECGEAPHVENCAGFSYQVCRNDGECGPEEFCLLRDGCMSSTCACDPVTGDIRCTADCLMGAGLCEPAGGGEPPAN